MLSTMKPVQTALVLVCLHALVSTTIAQIAPIGTQGSYPDIQLDAAGNLHLVYARSYRTYYRLINPAANSISPEEYTGVGASKDHQYQPDVAIDSKGVVHVLGNAHYNTRVNGVWGTATRPPNISRDHHMTIDSGDNVWVVYRAAKVAVSQLKAGNSIWEPRVSIFGEGTSNHVYPDITAGTDGSVHVVFRAFGAPYMKMYDCGYARYDGSKWFKAEWPCGNAYAKVEEGPHVAVDTNNVPWVSFPDGATRVTGRVGGSWQTPKAIGAGHSRDDPTIGIDRGNNMVVAWWGGYYSAYDSSKNEWTSGRLQSTTADPIGFVDVVGGENGCYVAWEQGQTIDKEFGAGSVDLVVAKVLPDASVVPYNHGQKKLFEVDLTTFSSSKGGTLTYTLTTSSTYAGRAYLVVAGVTGTSPGTPLIPPAVLPLNLDAISYFTYAMTFVPGYWTEFFGFLDSNGTKVARAPFQPGILISIVGYKMYFAYLLFPGDVVSNPIEVSVIP